MKRLSILICLLLACNLLFAEIQWQDVDKDNENGITAMALCDTEEEVLKVTHWTSLKPYFKSYLSNDVPVQQTAYLVIFMNLGTVVYEFHKGSKAYGYYMKTIFE